MQQLTCEQTTLKRNSKEHETKAKILCTQLTQDQCKYVEENELLRKELTENVNLCHKLMQEVSDHKEEKSMMRRKFELALKEVNKELQHCRKSDIFDSSDKSNSSSSSSLSNGDNGAIVRSPQVAESVVQVK